MPKRYSTISSPSSANEVYYDCTDSLKPTEILSSYTITSQDTTLLAISGDAINTTEIVTQVGTTGPDQTIAIGRGLVFTVTSQRETGPVEVGIEIVFTGSLNTSLKDTVIQPIDRNITS